MSSLIITIMAIALVSILAVATIYYAGAIQTEAEKNAKAAAVLNQAQQIQGAVTLYAASGGLASDLDTLIDESYLNQVPAGVWDSLSGYAVTEATEDVCFKVNKDLGIADIPQCDDPAYSKLPVCCEQTNLADAGFMARVPLHPSAVLPLVVNINGDTAAAEPPAAPASELKSLRINLSIVGDPSVDGVAVATATYGNAVLGDFMTGFPVPGTLDVDMGSFWPQTSPFRVTVVNQSGNPIKVSFEYACHQVASVFHENPYPSYEFAINNRIGVLAPGTRVDLDCLEFSSNAAMGLAIFDSSLTPTGKYGNWSDDYARFGFTPVP